MSNKGAKVKCLDYNENAAKLRLFNLQTICPHRLLQQIV